MNKDNYFVENSVEKMNINESKNNNNNIDIPVDGISPSLTSLSLSQ